MTKDCDELHRFLLGTAVRGGLIRLNNTWSIVLERADYPDNVRDQLGQLLIAAALLSATVKTKGKLTLQIRGSGPLNLMVAQVTSDKGLRCTANWKGTVPAPGSDLSTIFGDDAQMLLTAENTINNEQYQGIVELSGSTLSEALQQFFMQSEQLLSSFWMVCDKEGAAGIMLQKMPAENKDKDLLQRLKVLTDTVTDEELMTLDAKQLLWRLYHEEDIIAFDAEPMHFECQCSRERTQALIQPLGEQEALQILAEETLITVTCEFCSASYSFDSIDVTQIFHNSGNVLEETQTKH